MGFMMSASTIRLASPATQVARNDGARDQEWIDEATVCPIGVPVAPRTIGETGLTFLSLVELTTKIFFQCGQMRLIELAERSKLSVGVLEPILSFMRTERLCEVHKRGEAETDITYTLTELGRLRAQDFLQRNQYAGAAPVSLKAYIDRVGQQSVTDMRITRDQVRQVFAGIVIKEHILDQFGVAMNSGRSIFVHGPAGSGKTFIAEKMIRLLSGTVFIPYAIAVDTEIIQVFDPLVHKPVAETGVSRRLLERQEAYDERWVRCLRPTVVAGGELTLSMLELDFDENARYYSVPPQVKANNGMLIIDDLGRQLVQAQDLMNRWIVPLDRRVDYLSLHTGKKFMMPFDVTVVFCTNLSPAALSDEAFLRRLGHKIYIGELDEQDYGRIFRKVCEEMKIEFSEAGLNYVVHQLHVRDQKKLLACIPRDLLGQVRDIARYEGIEPAISPEVLERAWGNYFVRTDA